MLSIIIITLNEEVRVGRLLNNLKQQNFQDFEVIIVDSDSEDNTRGIAQLHAKRFREFHFHKMSRKGVSLGRNTGVKLAKYENILFLDADVLLPADFLQKMMAEVDRKGIGVASAYFGLFKFNKSYFLAYQMINLGFFISQFFSPTAVGACLFSTKKTHQKIGGFNERIYLCEDCDYVKRASKVAHFQMLPMFFFFDSRRMELEGSFGVVWKYLKANMTRFVFGKELYRDTCNIEYKFDHYKSFNND